MKIGVRLTLGFLAIILVVGLTAIFSINTYRKIHKEFEVLRDDIVPDAIAMTEMVGRCNQIAHDTMDYVVAEAAEEAAEEEEEVMTGFELLKKAGRGHLEYEIHIDEEEQKQAQELLDKIGRFNSAVMEVINLKKQGVSSELLVEQGALMDDAKDALVKELEEHKAVHMRELAEAEEAVHEAHTLGVRTVLLTTFIGLLLATVIAIAITRSIVRPLQTLHKGTEAIGRGNLDYKVGTAAKDEIGLLSRAFDKMTKDLKNTTTSIEDLNKEVSERKRMEEALRESENKHRTLLENLPQKIFSKDKNSVYISSNENYARDLKIEPDDILGKTDYDFYPKELAEKYRADDKRIVESGKVEDIEEDYIQDGKKVLVHTVKTPVRDNNGNVIGILGIFWDITEQKNAEEELTKHREHLEELVKERTAELRKMVNLMAGREVRMAELKEEIRKLHAQLESAGLTPVADDPLKETGEGKS